MFQIELTQIDYRAGTTKTWIGRKQYKTRMGAQKACQAACFVCKPDGKVATSEVRARIIE